VSDDLLHQSAGKLFSIIHRYARRFFEHEFAGLDIGHGPRNFLAALSLHEGITQEELSEMLLMDKTTTARSVKTLVEKGYVSRQKDEHDHRKYRLFLTNRGKVLAPDLWTAREKWTRTLCRGFSEEEQQQIHRFLKRIAENAVNSRQNGCSSEKTKPSRLL